MLPLLSGHFSDFDLPGEAGSEQEHAGGVAGILRPAQEPATPGPLLQPAREASSEFRLLEKPEVARPQEQPPGPRGPASRRPLHHCQRLRHVRQEGERERPFMTKFACYHLLTIQITLLEPSRTRCYYNHQLTWSNVATKNFKLEPALPRELL